MTSIRSWQFSGSPASANTKAAASSALSFLAVGSAGGGGGGRRGGGSLRGLGGPCLLGGLSAGRRLRRGALGLFLGGHDPAPFVWVPRRRPRDRRGAPAQSAQLPRRCRHLKRSFGGFSKIFSAGGGNQAAADARAPRPQRRPPGAREPRGGRQRARPGGGQPPGRRLPRSRRRRRRGCARRMGVRGPRRLRPRGEQDGGGGWLRAGPH